MKAIEPVEGVSLKSLRYAEVRWLDAVCTNSWVAINGKDNEDVAECISRGWVMKETDNQIVLCGSISISEDKLVDGANNTIAIPKGMVQSIVDFPQKVRRLRKAPRNKGDQPTPPDVLAEQFKEKLA